MLLLAPAAQAGPLLGIGEQVPQHLQSPYFAELGVRQIRLTVPWDAIDNPERLDQQMAGAQALGLTPLVVFEKSRNPAQEGKAPSRKSFIKRFKAFRARYPQVRTFATWNEANFKGQPTMKRPKLVAGYYRDMRRACRRCTVLIASLLDTRNLTDYARTLRRAAKTKKPLWGLHNYGDVSRLRGKTTAKFLKAVKGKVWLVETGALAAYRGPSENLRKRPAGEESQAAAVRYLLGPMAKRFSKRVTRIYIYQWQTSAQAEWDSGLLRPDGTPRPAYEAVKQAIASSEVRVK